MVLKVKKEPNVGFCDPTQTFIELKRYLSVLDTGQTPNLQGHIKPPPVQSEHLF